MIGPSRRTFKDLVDEVLSWGGMGDDTANHRQLAEYAVQASHERRLSSRRWTFMLYPTPQTFSTVGGQQNYSLHEAFLTPYYFKSRTSETPLVQVPYDQILNHLPADYSEQGDVFRFVLQGISKVKNQPAAASTITATAGHASDLGKLVTIVGETANGVESETIGLTNTGSKQFINVLDVIKGAGTFVGTTTISAGATTLLTLSPTQYGRQFQQLRFLNVPQGTEVVEYNFFRQPKQLTVDNDIPDTPFPFDRIHVYDALLKLQDVMRPTAGVVAEWRASLKELEDDMDATYQDNLSMGSETSYVTYVER